MNSWRRWLLAATIGLVSSLCLAQAQEESGEKDWYPLDSLNTGLGQAPESVSLRTPRESMRSFRDMTDRSDFEAAAHILNLADLTPAEQRERGAELARQLSEIFQRGESIRISRLSGRQDAVVEDPTGKSPYAGEPRRDIELASLEADGDAYDIRLGRYRVGEEEPIWLIMPESVAAIPALYEEYGPAALSQTILPGTVENAIRIGRYWIAHGLSALGILFERDEDAGTQRVLKWIERRHKAGELIEGNQFIHPQLRLSFAAPQGFYMVNGTSAVSIQGQGGQAQLSLAQYNGNLDSYVRNVFAALGGNQQQLAPQSIQRTTVNGIPAAYGTARVNSGNGQVDVA